MMNTLIVTPCGLPIPAVKGGAVLTLMESIIKENERCGQLKLTIVGVYDSDAEAAARKYPHTDFIFLKIPTWVRKIDNIAEAGLSKIFGNQKACGKEYARKLFVICKIKKILNKGVYDRVVFQNAGFLLKTIKNKDISQKYKGKVYYHLHNDIPNNISVPEVKQCRLLLISEYLKKHINDVCKENMESQCVILKNGFDCDAFIQNLSEKEKGEILNKLNIHDGKKIVLFTGRIVPAKGIEELTEAFSKLNRDDVVLLVVGAHNFGTGQTSEFQRRMEDKFCQLGEKVIFTGYVPYNEIWKYYKIADVAVLPSTWEEPAGLTMIEACAAGIPLVTTRSGGIPEYVPDGNVLLLDRNEHLVDNIRDAVNEVLDNSNLWEEKAKRAQKYVSENFGNINFYNNFCKTLM